MADGPVFVERIDYEAAREACAEMWPYSVAKESEVRAILDAALVGVREAKESIAIDPDATRLSQAHVGVVTGDEPIPEPKPLPKIRRFVTEWEPVEGNGK